MMVIIGFTPTKATHDQWEGVLPHPTGTGMPVVRMSRDGEGLWHGMVMAYDPAIRGSGGSCREALQDVLHAWEAHWGLPAGTYTVGEGDDDGGQSI